MCTDLLHVFRVLSGVPPEPLLRLRVRSHLLLRRRLHLPQLRRRPTEGELQAVRGKVPRLGEAGQVRGEGEKGVFLFAMSNRSVQEDGFKGEVLNLRVATQPILVSLGAHHRSVATLARS